MHRQTVAALAALALPAVAAAETPSPACVVGAPLNWAKKPRPERISMYAPERALRMGVNGMATIACRPDAKGALTTCAVAAEEPKGFAFALASQTVAKREFVLAHPECFPSDQAIGMTFRIEVYRRELVIVMRLTDVFILAPK